MKRNGKVRGSIRDVVVGGILLITVVGNLAAQSVLPSGALNYDKKVIEYHFSRADREVSVERWLIEARKGIGLAQEAWERLALNVLEGEELRAEKEKLAEWSEGELWARYAQWLSKSFFAREGGRATRRISANVRSEKRGLFYELDSEGKIIYDPQSGDPLVVRPGGGRYLEEDREEYQRYIDGENEIIFEIYQAKLERYYPELLEHIQVGKRGAIEEYIKGAVIETKEAVIKEFERIKVREDRLLTAKRSGDIWSLRKKSDREAASVISVEIIAETQEICDKNIAALQERIEELRGGTSDIRLEGGKWLSDYEERFKAGLKAWQEAEERFFVRRIEWEQAAGKNFTEGEEAWAAAFNRLAKERERWELKSKELYEAGEKLFINLSAELEGAIKSAKEEMLRDIETRGQNAGERAQAWLETYIGAGKVIASSYEYIEFWIKELRDELNTNLNEAKRVCGEKKKNLSARMTLLSICQKEIDRTKDEIHYKQDIYGNKTSYVVTVPYHEENILNNYREQVKTHNAEIVTLLNEIAALETRTASLNAQLAEANKEAPDVSSEGFGGWIKANTVEASSEILAKRELATWFDMYSRYRATAFKARETLVGEFGLVMGGGALADVLNEGARSGDFNLDEFQVELLRAQAVSNYWQRKEDIARAVYDYSKELSAGRATDTESEAEWNAAKERYYEAKAAYESNLEKLKSAQNKIEAQKEEMDGQLIKMREAEAEVSRLNEEFMNLKILLEIRTAGETIKEEMIEQFEAYIKMEEEAAKSSGEAVYYNYLQKARRLGKDNIIFNAEQRLVVLARGDDEMPAMSELEKGSVDYKLREAEIKLLSAESLTEWLNEVINSFWYGFEPLTEEDNNDIKDGGARAWLENQITNLIDEYKSICQNEELETPEDEGGGIILNLEYVKRLEEKISIYGELYSALERNADSSFAVIKENYEREKKSLKNLLSEFERAIEETQEADKGNEEKDAEKKVGEDGLMPSPEKTRELLLSGAENFSVKVIEIYKRVEALSAVTPKQFSGVFADWNGAFLSYAAALCVENGIRIDVTQEEIREVLANIETRTQLGIGDASELSEEQKFFRVLFLLVKNIDDYKADAAGNDSEKQKHWRLYLDGEITNDFFKKNQKEINGYFAETQGAALLKDRELQYLYYTNLFNGAIKEFDADKEEFYEAGNESFSGLKQKADGYLNNPDGFVLDEIKEDFAWREELKDEMSAQQNLWGQIEYQRQQFALLGAAYELATDAGEKIKAEMEDKKKEFEEAEAVYKNTVLEFDGQAKVMLDKTNDYEAEYEITMSLYNTMAQRRHDYEKQDAIRRWAGTAYTGKATPEAELIAAKGGAERAEIILRALSDVYNNNETRREYNSAEYDKLYQDYKKSFEEMAFTGRVKYELEAEIKLETERNNELYRNYKENISKIAGDLFFSRNGESIKNSRVFELIEVDEEGRLRFATGGRDDNFLALYKNQLQKAVSMPFGKIIIPESFIPGTGGITFMTREEALKFKNLTSDFAGQFEINQTEAEQDSLNDYFTAAKEHETETREVTDFELSLRNLTEYLNNNITSTDAYIKWGLAKDFLVQMISCANVKKDSNEKDFHVLENDYFKDSIASGAGGNMKELPAEMSALGYNYVKNVAHTDYELWQKQLEAYNALSPEARANLEFYTILSLAGGGGSESGFLKGATEYVDRKKILDIASAGVADAQKGLNISLGAYAAALVLCLMPWTTVAGGIAAGIAWVSILKFAVSLQELSFTKSTAENTVNEIQKNLNTGVTALNGESSNSISYLDLYKKSSDRLAALKGETKDSSYVSWEGIELSLTTSERFSEEQISKVKLLWDAALNKITIATSDVPTALGELLNVKRAEREKNLEAWNAKWSVDEEERYNAQEKYRSLTDTWIATGKELDTETLSAAIQKVYGASSAARKNHINLTGTELLDDFTLLNNSADVYAFEIERLAAEYAATAARAAKERLEAELAAQETLWGLQRSELQSKYNSWKRTYELILEAGRADWKAGENKTLASYQTWRNNFNKEYEQISAEWDAAYLAGLEEKNRWVEAATQAAAAASKGDFESLMSANKAKSFDAFEPLGKINADASLEAARILKEVLSASGITRMEAAMKTLNGTIGDMMSQKAARFDGNDLAQAATAKKNAVVFAKEMNEEIAARESMRLAATLKKQIQALKEGILDAVKTGNEGFKKQMDEMFVSGGQWVRVGRDYRKEVIVHSTLIKPVITENAFVEGYKDYYLEQDNISLDIKADLSREKLEGLNSVSISLIMREAQKEIKTKQEQVFGKWDGNEKKYTSKGTFDYWTGQKIEKNAAIDGLEEFAGGIEYNRLVKEFSDWAKKEGEGIAGLTAALWEKPLWDSRGSWFQAPSLKGIASIAVSAVAIAVTGGMATPLLAAAASAGMGLANSLLFNTLDLAGGYKTADEALFSFGKDLLVAAADFIPGGGSIAKIGQMTTKQLLVQGGKTLLNSTLNNVTYSGKNGWGFNTDGFLKSAVSGAVALGAQAGLAKLDLGAKLTGKFGDTIGNTMTNGIESLTLGTINATLSSVSYTGGGFDWGNFKNGMANAGRGAMSSAVTTAVSSGLLNSSMFKDGNGLKLSAKTFDVNNMEKFANLTGTLVGQGLNVAAGGEAVFNLAMINSATKDGGWSGSSGLLELHLGGERGFGMNFGTGGIDMSIGSVIGAVKGIGEAMKIANSKMTETGASTLNVTNALSWSGKTELAGDIWNKKIGVNYGKLNGDYGNYEQGSNTIMIDESLIGGGRAGTAKLAAVVGHEGSHAYGNRIEGNAHLEGLDSYAKAASVLGVAADKSLVKEMVNALQNKNSWTENTGSVDHWVAELDANGKVSKVLDDGQRDKVTIIDANGNKRVVDISLAGSVSGNIAAAVGGYKQKEMNDIMAASGLDYKKGTGWFAKDESAVYVEPESVSVMPEKKSELATAVKNFASNVSNGVKKALDKIGGFFSSLATPKTTQQDVKTPEVSKFKVSNGDKTIELYGVDDNNPVVPQLRSQHDTAFSDIPAIKESGCNFMVAIAYAQMITGQVLTAQQTKDIWNEAVKDPGILTSAGTVNNNNAISNMALKKLGRDDIEIKHAEKPNDRAALIGYRVTVPYKVEYEHHTAGDVNERIVYNPGNTKGKTIRTREIYVYAK